MTDIPDMTGLTAKQTAFVEGVLTGKTGSQAYRDAGYSPNMSNARVTEQVKRLKQHPRISAVLTDFQLRIAEKVDLSVEAHIKELSELAIQAKGLKQINAAVRAVELKGKVAGHYVERIRQEPAPQVADAQKTVLQVISELLGDEQAAIAAAKMGVEWLPARDTEETSTEPLKTASRDEK